MASKRIHGVRCKQHTLDTQMEGEKRDISGSVFPVNVSGTQLTQLSAIAVIHCLALVLLIRIVPRARSVLRLSGLETRINGRRFRGFYQIPITA